MDGFRRPDFRRRNVPQRRDAPLRPSPATTQQHQREQSVRPPAVDVTQKPAPASTLKQSPPKKHRRSIKWLLFVIGLAALFVIGAAGWLWQGLSAVDPSDKSTQRVEIVEDTTLSYVAERLKARDIIKNSTAFKLYGRLSGASSELKVGTCDVTRSMSARQILDKLTSGCHDFVSITFYPGATIEPQRYIAKGGSLDTTRNIRNVLAEAGYDDAAIQSALDDSYDVPILADKPKSADLEGYIYAETYYIPEEASARDVIQTALTQFQKVADDNDLKAAYKKQGLTMFEGVTMASIVQRELNCEGKSSEALTRCHDDQRKIAQVLLTRLRKDMQLGSDVTFIYAADQLGVDPTIDLDSPYNTRKNTGLPPGPVASPGIHAFKSVANPANTDYLYFVAGDDGTIYYSKTLAQHEKYVKEHCKRICYDL